MDAKKIDPSCKEGYNTIRCEREETLSTVIYYIYASGATLLKFYVEVYISIKKRLTDLQSGLPPPSPSTLRQQWDLPSNRLSCLAREGHTESQPPGQQCSRGVGATTNWAKELYGITVCLCVSMCKCSLLSLAVSPPINLHFGFPHQTFSAVVFIGGSRDEGPCDWV